MKILRVTGDLYPSFVGGLAIHTHELSKYQAETGHEVQVYTSFWNDSTLCEQRDGYNIQRFKGPKFFRFSIELPLFFALFKNVRKYDVVHAHSHVYCCSLFCALIKKVKPYPLVITCHGLISQTVPMWIQKLYHIFCGKFVLKSADCIFTYTNYERDQLISYGVKPENIKVIHNGIVVEKFSNTIQTQRKKQIMWVGKYVPGKGVRYLIEGFGKFSINHPDYSLLLIGRGPEREMMCELIKSLNIVDKVTMVDFIPNDELQKIYQESEVYVSPALAEGVPKVILEAMLCGTPVVSTDLPQLIDLIDDCGVLVSTKNSEEIANALTTLADDSQLRETCGNNGHNRVLNNYNWADTVKQMTEASIEIALKYKQRRGND